MLSGFTQHSVLPIGMNMLNVCSCCGAMAITENAKDTVSSILIGNNLTEDQMKNTIAQPLPDSNSNYMYVNPKIAHGWDFVSIPIGEKETLSMLLQFPKETTK